MGRTPHKFAWNGVDIDTVLSTIDLAAICSQAAMESTGDLWNGKQRIEKIEDGDGWTLFVVKNAILAWQKFMTFSVDITPLEGRTKLSTTIHTYTTTQQTVLAFIPVSPKKMVAHHTYMQFVHKVANTVRAADASARIAIREGLQIPGALPVVGSGPTPAPVAAPGIAPTVAVNNAAETVPPPPPPATSPPLLPPPPPPPPVASSAAVAGSPAITTPAEDVIDDATRRVPRRARAAGIWELERPDGGSIPLDAAVLIGRDPASDDPTMRLTAVPDGERLVSKTHAAFDVRDGVVHVTDLHSANGTFLLAPNGDETQCEPDVPTPVRDGWEVELGSYPVIVRAVRPPR